VTEPTDDSLMNRFDRHGLRRFRARDAVIATAVAAFLLVLFAGASVRSAGEQMNPGVGRDVVLAVGKPAGSIADALPLADLADDATSWLSPDDKLNPKDGFTSNGPRSGGRVPPVTADAFDPARIGASPAPMRHLHTLLVTGDSMATPLDVQLARKLTDMGVRVIRDPHLGTGISKSFLVDWGQLSAGQVKRNHPDAVVMFIGANEGFPMPGPGGRNVSCCGPDWAAAYANRARQVANTFRQNGRARVYWIGLPTPRAASRQRIGRVVNEAIAVATQPWRSQVHVVDTIPIFTPNGYRDAMRVRGTETIVRRSDGIHLNDTGASLLAEILLTRLRQDFVF
jgi:lysophospholipase L1-like esterase